MRTALYPGSFDPLHNGHMGVIEAAGRHFDRVVVAAVRNPVKEFLFSLEERELMLKASLAHLSNVETTSFSGLVVDLARDIGADCIVKGLRAVSDMESELQQGQMNYAMSGIDTLLIPTTSRSSFVSSTYLKQFAKVGRDVSEMVPEPVAAKLREKFS